jgi:hypothetical protein
MAKRKRVKDSVAAKPERFKVGDQVAYNGAQWEIVGALDGFEWVNIERQATIRMLVRRDQVSPIPSRKAEP